MTVDRTGDDCPWADRDPHEAAINALDVLKTHIENLGKQRDHYAEIACDAIREATHWRRIAENQGN
jgi:hypothetical protein